MPSDACVEELETLSAIFLDEIVINDSLPDGGAHVSMMLFPATADDEESRNVTLTLEIGLCSNYPKVPPKITFRNPRGLNDLMLDDLMKSMKEKCDDRLESQMIYEIIDMGKEFLTKNNRPAAECPICLLSFTEFDVFFRTGCFHHFHSHCLGNYLHNLGNDPEHKPLRLVPHLTCPVCRESLADDIDVEKLRNAPPPSEEFESSEGESSNVLQDWEDKRQSMKEMFEKQKSQGGIIDLSENKKLLVISDSTDRESTSSDPSLNGSSDIGASAVTTAQLRRAHDAIVAHRDRDRRENAQRQGQNHQSEPQPRGRGYYELPRSLARFTTPRTPVNNTNPIANHLLPSPTASTNREHFQPSTENKPPAAAVCSNSRAGQGYGHNRKVKGGGNYNRRRNK